MKKRSAERAKSAQHKGKASPRVPARKPAAKKTTAETSPELRQRQRHHVAPVMRKYPKAAGWTLSAPVVALITADSEAPAREKRARVNATAVEMNDDALPEALRTGQGRTWFRRVKANRWDAAGMPARDFALLCSAISRRAVEALLSMTWQELATLRGFDPNAAKTMREGTSGIAAPGTVTRQTRSLIVRAAPAALPAQERALVDDRGAAVRIDSLPVGTAFKTPDSPREGIAGAYSVIEGKGPLSITIRRSLRLGEYIACGSMVVPIYATQT